MDCCASDQKHQGQVNSQRVLCFLFAELLPGIEEFLVKALARERLAAATEKKRLFFIERLEVIKMPPSLPPDRRPGQSRARNDTVLFKQTTQARRLQGVTVIHSSYRGRRSDGRQNILDDKHSTSKSFHMATTRVYPVQKCPRSIFLRDYHHHWVVSLEVTLQKLRGGCHRPVAVHTNEKWPLDGNLE